MIVNEKGGTEKDMDIATLVVVVLVIAVALTFDFTNGFHDTANAMATSIATGALKPKTAVIAAGTLVLFCPPRWQKPFRAASSMSNKLPSAPNSYLLDW